MTFWQYQWAFLREKLSMNSLAILFIALTVVTSSLLVHFTHYIKDHFMGTSQSFDAVVGAKGSPYQLILSSLFFLDIPTGNLSSSVNKAIERHPMVKRAIPVALGDHFANYPIIGTNKAYLRHFQTDLEAGRLWKTSMEAVIGAEVARSTGLKIGNMFSGSHGVTGEGHVHDDQPYRVVGILNSHSAHIDRLVFTDLKSVWQIHDHGASEITSLLITYKTRAGHLQFPRFVNQQTPAMAVNPYYEVTKLLQTIGVGEKGVMILVFIFLSLSLICLLITLYGQYNARLKDLYLLRILGASPFYLAKLMIVQASLLALLGIMIGIVLSLSILIFIDINSLFYNFNLGFFLGHQTLWLVMGMIMIVIILLSLFPARKAYRIALHDALQNL